MSPLPEDREKALEAIANGWARTPTTAHPLCTCVVDVTGRGVDDEPITFKATTHDSVKSCTIHGGTT